MGRTRRRWISSLAAAMALSWGGADAAAQDAGAGASPRARIERAFEAWAAGTGSPFELLADDARWTIAGRSAAAGTYEGRERFLAEVIRPFNARMSAPLRPTVHRILHEGSTVVVHFDAVGTARDGRPYHNTYAWIIDLRGDRIVNVVAFFDAIAFDELWARVPPVEP
jgi:ketosteroid isomerase-like protein